MEATLKMLDDKCKALQRAIAEIEAELPDLEGLAYSERYKTLIASKKSYQEAKQQISNISKL